MLSPRHVAAGADNLKIVEKKIMETTLACRKHCIFFLTLMLEVKIELKSYR